MTTTATKTGQPFDRPNFESLMTRRFFYKLSYRQYGGIKGLFDLGSAGAPLQTNIINLWRLHFALKERMFELDTPILTPYQVFETSGHVARFNDWMSKDPKTGELLRTDHLLEEALEERLKAHRLATGGTVEAEKEDGKKKKKKPKEKNAPQKLDEKTVELYEDILARIDDLDGPQLAEKMKEFNVLAPGGNEYDPPQPFNLMFPTTIGPSTNQPAFLRPETAQGQFLNFAELLETNNQSMPFASYSIGKSFRNEISPRSGLLRVREFWMAEIEHYVDPLGGKKHPRFSKVAHVELPLLDRETQKSGKTTVQQVPIGEAVKSGLVANETLGYFLARIRQFLVSIGLDPDKIRFRQHLANEMAHYAVDCWDAELLTSYGWIEAVGCADRSAYDLSVHSAKTGVPLVVRERLQEPKHIEEWQVELDKKRFGPRFKKDGKAVEAAVEALTQDLREKLSLDLKNEGKISVDVPGVGNGKVEIEKELIDIEKRTRVEHVREYTPNVIEPSFGLGRILYALCEQCYWTREGDEARGVLSFPPSVAPTKVLVVPLQRESEFDPLVQRLSERLDELDVANKVDDSGVSIGKRYARNDELGTPFGVTVDYKSLEDNSFTLRERDSTKQVRASEKEIIEAIDNMVKGRETWADVVARLPAFESADKDAE